MKKKILVVAGLLAMSGALTAQSVYPGQHAGKLKRETVAPMKVKSFDLKDVRLLPSRFRENMMRDSVWMASIEVDRLLHSFRTNAGVFAGREGGYMTVKKLGGWESLDCELRGHTTGHLLSAYGLMYAATGSEQFKQKGDSLVNGLAEVQTALGNGYLSAYPEELINRNIRGTSVWAPWYTLHKLFSGLIDQYLYSDNQKALEVVVLYAVSASHIVIAVYYVVIVGKASTQQDGTQEHTLFQIYQAVHSGEFINHTRSHTGSFRNLVRDTPRSVNHFLGIKIVEVLEDTEHHFHAGSGFQGNTP